MAGVHIEIHLHRQDRTAFKTNRRSEFKYRRLFLADASEIHRPTALALVAVNRAGHRQAGGVLLMRRLGIDQLHWHPLATFFVGGKHADIAERKIAVTRAAGSIAGHRLVRERLNPNGVQAHGLQLGREHPAIIGGILAVHEKGTVGLFGESRAIEGLGLQMIEDHPVLLLQRVFRRVIRPHRKAPGQLVFFKLGQGSRERRMRLFPFGSNLRKITIHR